MKRGRAGWRKHVGMAVLGAVPTACCSVGTLTLTISWARIPPTTAHTGAISEKQYLGEKIRGMKRCGTGGRPGVGR